MAKRSTELLEPKKRGRPKLRDEPMKLNASVETALVAELDEVAEAVGLNRASALEAAMRLWIKAMRRKL